MADPEFVTLQVEDGVGTIRLDRPKMNAIDEQLHREVRAAALEAGRRDDVRAVVLYGGERVFAAGADIKAMAQIDGTAMVAWGRELTSSFTEVAKLPKPVIAAVTGYALGGGYELALCADFRVLGAGAKIGQPEILLGVIPGAGGSQRLARLVGPAKAKDIIFTGRHVGAFRGLQRRGPHLHVQLLADRVHLGPVEADRADPVLHLEPDQCLGHAGHRSQRDVIA